MAASGIALALAKVPWSDVMDLARLGIDQAKRLTAQVKADEPPPAGPALEETYDARAAIERVAADNAELRRELAEASELITRLAETNQTVVAKLQVWQQWLWGLLGLSVASLVFAAIALLR